MPISSISPNFTAQIEQLSNDLADCVLAADGQVQRPWQQPCAPPPPALVGNEEGPPAPITPWDGNPFSISGPAGIAQDFYRADCNTMYSYALDNSGVEDGQGRLADRSVAKSQVDYLAAMERAFRARNATSVRCSALAAGRRSGQGESAGVFRSVRDYLNAALAAGYSENAGTPVDGGS